MISHCIKPRSSQVRVCIIRASGRVATRATKTPHKGVAVERGAERMSARSREVASRRSGVGLVSRRSARHRASSGVAYVNPIRHIVSRARGDRSHHSLLTNHSIPCGISNLMASLPLPASGGNKFRFYERSEFDLKKRLSILPIRFLVFVFNSKTKLSTSSRLLPLPIKKSPITA